MRPRKGKEERERKRTEEGEKAMAERFESTVASPSPCPIPVRIPIFRKVVNIRNITKSSFEADSVGVLSCDEAKVVRDNKCNHPVDTVNEMTWQGKDKSK